MTELHDPFGRGEGRVDLRDEWYGFDWVYRNQPPKIYWLGMLLSAYWVLIYLLIYPSIPFASAMTHWPGIGVPGGCQPWTAICELRKHEEVLHDMRGNYLAKIHTTDVANLAEDVEMVEFITRAGRVPFIENCGGCHGKDGAGILAMPNIAPALNDSIWLHGADVQAIHTSIVSPAIHPFNLARRTDSIIAKIFAIYVYNLDKGHGRIGAND